MPAGTRSQLLRVVLRKALFVFSFLLLALPAGLRAQQSDDFDQYKVRLDTYWFYSNPGGSVQGKSDEDPVDFQKDLSFNGYSTFAVKADWKFTRKNHFYVSFGRYNKTRQTILDQTITFRGQTFEVGSSVRTDLRAFLVAPGYQYDIIRRRRGHLGLGVQVDLFNTSAKISATAPVEGGGVVSAKGSLLAPIPVAGPQYRIYLTNSPRVFIEGNVYGMYFFGYGNFVSTSNDLGVTLNKHITFNAGYQVGSRLVVNVSDSANRIGLRLTEQGAIVGAEFSF
jgi:hypothetical protein